MDHLARPTNVASRSPVGALVTPNKMVKIFKSDSNLGTNREKNFDEHGPIGAIVRYGWLDAMQYTNDIFQVKTGASYSAVYELASHSKLLVELLDEAIEEAWGTSKDELPYHQEIKSRRSRFVEDVCAAIYTDSYTDSRIRELSNINLSISSHCKELFRHLAPPSTA